ncbi:major histocompatibility complex class I-related gene protein-like [Epinephelus fuscoguttatus]|uniref:major histocompatibility complex class I-related gene protein-like n=1 Tax=Epinephelus fuscoguttatus TaxID=293821 RepID=UPI0020D0F8CF|nr:major histocompatibility complex class I-related gene protein-like [Epinephelus fuscoguttatus]
MKNLLLLLLFCHIASPVKHSLKFFLTASSGVPNFPEFMGAAVVNELLVAYCNTSSIEPKQDWAKILLENFPQHMERYTQECTEVQPYFLKATIHGLKQRFNQTGGIHILQKMSGCEWDDETGEVNAFMLYGYDGEDFMSFDLKTLTWVTPKPQAVITKLRWDAEKVMKKIIEIYLTNNCPYWLKKYVSYGKSSLLRTGRIT